MTGKITDQDNKSDKQGESERNLEELFEQLETAIHRMEEEDLSLEDSFRLYHEGMDVLKRCNDRIDEVEKKMLILDEEGGVHEF